MVLFLKMQILKNHTYNKEQTPKIKNPQNSLIRKQHTHKKKAAQLKLGQRNEQTPQQRNTWMAHKHKKRCLTSTAIREMQSKATRLKND